MTTCTSSPVLFGVDVADHEIVLSAEHTEVCWLSFDDAHELAEYDGNKTALWELDQRLVQR